MTKLIKKFQGGGTADEIYRASYSLPTITIKSNRTPENYQKAQNARESEFYQNLIRRVAMNRATNIDYKWLKDNGITSEELNKDVAAHQLNVSNPIREQQHQKKINEEQQIKGIQNRENYEGLRKAITVAPFAPFAPYLVSGLGESLVTAPVQTIGNFATGMLGGTAVNKATGGWGNMLGEKLGIPEASNILDYTNPGYFVGFPTKVIANVAGNLVDRLPSNMVDRLLPSRVAVTPEGIQIPVNSGNNRTMNFGERIKGTIKGAYRGWKNTKPKSSSASKPSPQELSNIADSELLADIRYGRNRKRVKVMSPEKTETVTTTIDGKTVDPTTLVVEEKPTVNGFIVEQVVPGQPVYAYNGRPVLSNNVRNQEWFKYEGKYRPKSDIKTETTTTPSQQIEIGKDIPEGAWVINQKTGKPELLDRQIWRTPEGWGRKSHIYADGTPVEWYRNPGFWKQFAAGTFGTGTISALLFGARNTGRAIKGAGKGTISGNGAISGIVNEFENNKPNNKNSINNDIVSPYTLTEKDIEELSDTSAYDY